MTTNFGRDMSCTTGLRSGRYSSGALLVAEACYRRLTTPRGSLLGGEDEQNYGFDLNELVGKTVDEGLIASLPGRIRLELTKDERIDPAALSITVTATVTGAKTSLSIEIEAGTAEGPFTLQLRVTDVTLELVGIEAEAA